MKIINAALATLIMLAISITSCKKDDDAQNPAGDESLQAYYDRNSPGMQYFVIDPSLNQTITGNQGTQLTFPANSLVKSNGQIATGNVVIRLKEVYDKSDMLFLDKPTITSDSIPLKSGGEVFINAHLQETGEALQVSDSAMVNIFFPDPFPNPAPVDTMFAWIQAPNEPFSWVPMIQNGWQAVAFSTLGGYTIQTDTLTWINCDQPIFSNPWIKLNLAGTQDANQYMTDVFLFFENKTMIHVYRSLPYEMNIFTNNYTPQNTDLTVVAIGKNSGKFYAAFEEVNSGTSDKNVTFTMSEISETDLDNAIRSLD